MATGQCHEDDAGRSHDWNVVQQWREQHQEEPVDPIERQKTMEEAIDQGKAVKSEQLSRLFLDRQPSRALRMASTGYRHYEVISCPLRSALWRCGAGRDNKVCCGLATGGGGLVPAADESAHRTLVVLLALGRTPR